MIERKENIMPVIFNPYFDPDLFKIPPQWNYHRFKKTTKKKKRKTK